MAILDDFKLRFPEFEAKGVDVDGLLPPIIEIVSCLNGWDYTTKCGKEVILNLLAHLLVIASSPDYTPIGTVSGVSVGDVSITNSVTTALASRSGEFFNTTKYGRMYLQLISCNIGGVFV